MKKFLLASLLFAGGLIPVAAQGLVVQYQGNDVPNGGEVVFDGYTATPDATYPEWITWKVDPELHLVASEQKAVQISANSNVSINLCAGGNCIQGTDLKKAVENFTAGTPVNLQLDWEETTMDGVQEYDIPEVVVDVKIWYEEDPDNVYSFTLKMGGVQATAGVEDIISGQNAVSFNGNTLYYDLNSASQLNVYSLSGKVVISKTVSGNGSLSLANLPKGIYLYKLSGKASKAAKIVIR